jgi:hypothetical protein
VIIRFKDQSGRNIKLAFGVSCTQGCCWLLFQLLCTGLSDIALSKATETVVASGLEYMKLCKAADGWSRVCVEAEVERPCRIQITTYR